jgi:hypothetical protein
VRGAQLPAAEPLRLRRAGGDQVSPGGAGSRPPQRGPERQRSADDVYAFLSSFTAGVKRGLDESNGDG